MADLLENLTDEELRNLALDQKILAANLMGRDSLTRSLRGDKSALLKYLESISTKELRNESLNRGVFAARFMTRSSLIKSLRGDSLKFQYLYLLPIAVIWKVLVLVPLTLTVLIDLVGRFFSLIFKPMKWVFSKHGKSKPEIKSPKTITFATNSPVQPEARESKQEIAYIVQVREVLLREISIIQISRSEDLD